MLDSTIPYENKNSILRHTKLLKEVWSVLCNLPQGYILGFSVFAQCTTGKTRTRSAIALPGLSNFRGRSFVGILGKVVCEFNAGRRPSRPNRVGAGACNEMGGRYSATSDVDERSATAIDYKYTLLCSLEMIKYMSNTCRCINGGGISCQIHVSLSF